MKSNSSDKAVSSIHLLPAMYIAQGLMFICVAVGFYFLESLAWFSGSFVLAGWLSLWLRRNIHDHRGPEDFHMRMGPGFWVTWCRSLAVVMIAGFACAPGLLEDHWKLVAVLYGLNVFLDLVDGVVARASDTVSPMGARLDSQIDALGLFVASLCALMLKVLPAHYIVLSVSYFLFHFGIWWRRGKNRVVHPERMMKSVHNRYFAGAHMILVLVAISSRANPSVLTGFATLGEMVLLACFARDWLLVSGRVSASSSRFNGYWRWLGNMALVRGSVLARLLMVVALSAGSVLYGVSFLTAALVVPCACGFFGRTFAWLFILTAAFGLIPLGSPIVWWLLGPMAWVCWLGSGPGSLTRVDDVLYLRQFRLGWTP